MVHSKTGTFNSVSFLWADAELRIGDTNVRK